MFKNLLAKLGNWLKPLWKGAAKKILASQFTSLRERIKRNIDDDRDASIMRINTLFDKMQSDIIGGLDRIAFLPQHIRELIKAKVQAEGDRIQEDTVAMVKKRGPVAIDAAFDGIEARLDAMIDAM